MARLLTVALLLSLVTVARGQELEPRSYVNVPINQNFLAFGVARSDGELEPSPGTPLEDAELTLDTGVLGYVRTLDIGGKSGNIGLVATRTCLEGSATFRGEFVEGRRCGYGDLSAKFSYNFYGAPALTLDEFRQWQPGLVIGAGLLVLAPVGTYSSDFLINTGGNRWMIRPSIGLSNTHGRFSYDVMASVRFYEDNEEYFEGLYLEQDPVIQVQTHLIWALPRGQWISLNANFFRGGATTIDGSSMDNRQENSRWGVTYALPLNARHSLKFYANTGIITRIGNNFDTFGVAWQFRFEG